MGKSYLSFVIGAFFCCLCSSCLSAMGWAVGANMNNVGNANNNLQQQFLQGYANNFWKNYNENPQQYQNVPVSTYNNNVGYSGSSEVSTSNASSNSSSSSTYQKSCPSCLGSGKCKYCNGSGYVTRMGIGSGTHYCAVCTNHNGICTLCKGTGKQ